MCKAMVMVPSLAGYYGYAMQGIVGRFVVLS